MLQLQDAVRSSLSYRQVIQKLGLIPAGGNYRQVMAMISSEDISVSHFTGKLWNKGKKLGRQPRIQLDDILVRGVPFQSYKLKTRLFEAGLKERKCELCGWRERAQDGRIPVELDHANGDNSDNRIENLRILCPNCHSLQATHRGKNKKLRAQ